MDTLKQLRDELEAEYRTTKKFLGIYPDNKNDYAPHLKSMKMMHLATHITEVFGWTGFMLKTSELDFANSGMQPKYLSTKDELLQVLDENYSASKNALENAS